MYISTNPASGVSLTFKSTTLFKSDNRRRDLIWVTPPFCANLMNAGHCRVILKSALKKTEPDLKHDLERPVAREGIAKLKKKKIQVYVDEGLYEKLQATSHAQKTSLNGIVVKILQDAFNMNTQVDSDMDELRRKVFKEVQDFIKDKEPGLQFDLGTASPSLNLIPVTEKGKPSLARGRLGRDFYAAVERGDGQLARVVAVRKPDGDVQKSARNATMYVVVAPPTRAAERKKDSSTN